MRQAYQPAISDMAVGTTPVATNAGKKHKPIGSRIFTDNAAAPSRIA